MHRDRPGEPGWQEGPIVEVHQGNLNVSVGISEEKTRERLSTLAQAVKILCGSAVQADSRCGQHSVYAGLRHKLRRQFINRFRDCRAAGFATPRTPVATSPAAARSTRLRAAHHRRAVRATPARNLPGRVREGKAAAAAQRLARSGARTMAATYSRNAAPDPHSRSLHFDGASHHR